MSRSKDDWINQRSYALWESEGRPNGRSSDHWSQAAREYRQLELSRASVDGSDLIERLRTMGRLMHTSHTGNAIDVETREHNASV